MNFDLDKILIRNSKFKPSYLNKIQIELEF